MKKYYKLDYSIPTPEERVEYVRQLLRNETEEQVSRVQLEYLANYILDALSSEEKSQHKILTDNRLYSIKKRETSFEGLALTLENGEDGIYAMATTNPHQYLTLRGAKISEEDIMEDSQLYEIKKTIEQLQKKLDTAEGHESYILKKNIIELSQLQYLIKKSNHPPVYSMRAQPINYIDYIHPLAEEIKVSNNGNLVEVISGVSLIDPTHVAAILSLYNELKAEGAANIESDVRYLIEELDEILEGEFKEKYYVHYLIAKMKIDGKTNVDIREKLAESRTTVHTNEYISSLWTKKIPKEIADIAEKKYVNWYYQTQEPGLVKKCSQCGQIKLMNERFFSKNKSSKDGYYSLCKECRNKKAKERNDRIKFQTQKIVKEKADKCQN